MSESTTHKQQEEMEQNKQQSEHKHHHHHHSSSDGHHHHHHHHSSVRVVTGNKSRRIPWLEGLGLIVVALIVFYTLITCTKILS